LGVERRAYEQYEAGNRKIPDNVADKALELARVDRLAMGRAIDSVVAKLLTDFPHGIQSEQEAE
jgi:hypothetical protein